MQQISGSTLQREKDERILFSSEGKKPISPQLRAKANIATAHAFAALMKAISVDESSDLDTFKKCRNEALSDAKKALLNIEEIYGKNSSEYLEISSVLAEESVRCANGISPISAPMIKKAAQPLVWTEKPIFSPTFDSTAGRGAQNQEDVEITLLQLAASGYTVLLQAPQIVDNLSFLRLLHSSALQNLCLEGVVALSAYTPASGRPISSTTDYLISRLNADGFAFSSTDAYASEKVKKCITEGLENGKMFSSIAEKLPAEKRAELEELYDSYIIAEQVFRPSQVRKWHQDKNPGTVRVVSLPEMISQRIQLLTQDEAVFPVVGRKDTLGQFKEIQEKVLKTSTVETGAWRSAYKHQLETMTGQYDKQTLRLFSQLVDQSYSMNMGRRSCRRIFNNGTLDEILHLHAVSDNSGSDVIRATESEHLISYVSQLYKDRTTNHHTTLDWINIIEVIQESRKIYAKAKSTEDFLQVTDERLGVGLQEISAGDFLCADFNVKTLQGNTVNISSSQNAESPDSSTYGVEINTPKGDLRG